MTLNISIRKFIKSESILNISIKSYIDSGLTAPEIYGKLNKTVSRATVYISQIASRPAENCENKTTYSQNQAKSMLKQKAKFSK